MKTIFCQKKNITSYYFPSSKKSIKLAENYLIIRNLPSSYAELKDFPMRKTIMLSVHLNVKIKKCSFMYWRLVRIWMDVRYVRAFLETSWNECISEYRHISCIQTISFMCTTVALEGCFLYQSCEKESINGFSTLFVKDVLLLCFVILSSFFVVW